MNTRGEIKVQYIAQACDFCKTRHLKCDGIQPCAQCVLRKQTCIYTAPTRKRGRKPKDEASRSESRVKRTKSETQSKTDTSNLNFDIQLTRNQKSLLKKIKNGEYDALNKEDIVDLVKIQNSYIENVKSYFKKTKKEKEISERDDLIKDIDIHSNLDFGTPVPTDVHTFSNTLIKAYSSRNSFLYPPGTNLLEDGLASEILMKINDSNQFKALLKSDLFTLTDTYCYNIVFMYGCKIIGKWNLGHEYSNRCDIIIDALIKRNIHENTSLVTKILSYMTFQVLFLIGRGDLLEAKRNIFTQYFLLNLKNRMISNSIAYGVIGYMASVSINIDDRIHWLNSLESINTLNMSPYNDVIRSVLIISGCLYSDDILYDLRQLKQKPSEKELLLRQKLYTQIDETLESMDARESYIFGQKNTVIFALKNILISTKSLAALLLSKYEESVTLAQKAISNLLQVDINIYTVLQLLSTAFTIQVSIYLRHAELYRFGMDGLKNYLPILPIANKIWNYLSEQGKTLETQYLSNYINSQGRISDIPPQYPTNIQLTSHHDKNQINMIPIQFYVGGQTTTSSQSQQQQQQDSNQLSIQSSQNIGNDLFFNPSNNNSSNKNIQSNLL